MRQIIAIACCALACAAGCNDKSNSSAAPADNSGSVVMLEEATRVVVEVEAGDVAAPFEIASDSSTGGGKYVAHPEEWVTHKEINPALKRASDGTPVDKDGLKDNPPGSKLVPNGSVALRFRIPKTAKYAFWARANFHCACGDNFFFSIDSPAPVDTDGNGEYDENPPLRIGGSTYGRWKWYSYKGQSFELAEGEHTVSIFPREDGVKIDQLLFAEIPAPPLDAYIPQGIEESQP